MIDFLGRTKEKVLIFDGAMGTSIQKYDPSLDDYIGLDGCNEILVVTRPNWITDIHESFLAVGCDIIETNTFGASPVVLGEYGIADRTRELNRKAAMLAKEVAHGFSTSGHIRYVSGSVGPTTKLPSLGHVRFRELVAGFREQVLGLIEGGVDLIQIETCQDILQTKAALVATSEAYRHSGRFLPTLAQVTMETTGTMLLGTEILAAVATLEAYRWLDGIGINCATGPVEMEEHVRALSHATQRLISVLPNAGLPENVGGCAHYRLTPDELAVSLAHFADVYGVNLIGGCCGTTPTHLAKVVQVVGNRAPGKRALDPEIPSVASLYVPVTLRQIPPPLLIGERTNANGSKQFRQLLQQGDFDAMVQMAKEQAQEGAHVLDVCTAYVGRDEVSDMAELVTRFATQVTLPLVIDSTEPPVVEAALELIGGRAIVNSIHLEDGGDRLRQVAGLCVKHGAAVVALTIDEDGMAKTADRKLTIAKRIAQIASDEFGLRPEDILFDPLTFTLGSGDPEFRRAGIETLNAIRRIKQEIPGAHTVLGVSNISFGLAPHARHVLNSVFLHHAVEHGLDAAIVHAAKILPLYRIDPKHRKLAEAVIFDDWTYDGDTTSRQDPLTAFMASFEGTQTVATQEKLVDLPVDVRLKKRIVDGNGRGLDDDLKTALVTYSPLDIINNILLDGMKEVGELFGSGKMQLPFVLQSAEVMKTSVKFLEPLMEKTGTTARGTLVLATVKGDVHDIGKNLVDIILTNNGYKVINLGIKQPISAMLDAAETHGAHAIGMSGLLVKSTAIMRENLIEMNERHISIPVILGGAALTRRFVEVDLRELYLGQVYYGNDAFAGLRIMDELTQPEHPRKETLAYHQDEPVIKSGAIRGKLRGTTTTDGGEWVENDVARDVPIPPPPFWGSRVVRNIDLDQIFANVNETALFRHQWQFRRRGEQSKEDFEIQLETVARPIFDHWKKRCVEESLLDPQVVYGYFRCQSDKNDLIVYPETNSEPIRFRFPRQAAGKRLCIADYFRSLDSGEQDVIAIFAVTMGAKVAQIASELFQKHAYQDYLYLHGIGVEAAEALSEVWHTRIRMELGISLHDSPDITGLFQQKYQGARFSFGYPACPDLSQQQGIFHLLNPARIGMVLNEEWMLEPEQSTTAIVAHHPEARYFNV